MIKRWVVYLAHMEVSDGQSMVKIGATSNHPRRLKELQASVPDKVTMPRIILTDHKQIAHLLERALHEELRAYHLHDEWFEDHQDVWDIFGKYEKDGLAAASELC